MKRNSKRAPDLVKLDLTDMNAVSEVIKLKPHATIPKNKRDRIVLALKAYTSRANLTNKYIELAPDLDEFGDDADHNTSNLTPQDIRERIADIVTEAVKLKATSKSKTKTNSTLSPSNTLNKVSPSPLKKSKERVVHEFPNAKKQLLNEESDTKR